jgi:hypothetical protein
MDAVEVKAYQAPLKTAGALTSFGDPTWNRCWHILGTPLAEAVTVYPPRR